MEMWCIKIGLRPMIAIFTVIRFSKYTTILLPIGILLPWYYRNHHLHRLGAGKATGTINEEEDEEQGGSTVLGDEGKCVRASGRGGQAPA